MAGETDGRLSEIGPVGKVKCALVILSTESFQKPIGFFYQGELDPTRFQLNDGTC